MKFRTIAIICASLACASICNAEWILKSYNIDPSIQNADVISSAGSSSFSSALITGDQIDSPGSAVMEFATDIPGDPDIWQGYKIKNKTDFVWTDYHVDVWMDHIFTISDAGVDIPGDWTVNFPINSIFDNIHNRYEATVDYFAGTPIQIGGTFQFNYTISYPGSDTENIVYGQTLTPTPEPGTLVLLFCGVLGLLAVRRRFA